MNRSLSFRPGWSPGSALLALVLTLPWAAVPPSAAQVQEEPSAPAPLAAAAAPAYRSQGQLGDQPFSVEVTDVQRTPAGSLVVRLLLRNTGSRALRPGYAFAAGTSLPVEADRISGVCLVGPEGQPRIGVVRDQSGEPQCSTIDPELAPGEKREVTARFPALPPTVTTVNVAFPGATQTIRGVPIQGDEESSVATSPGVATRRPGPPATPASRPANSNSQAQVQARDQVVVEQTAPKRSAGTVSLDNEELPFSLEVVSLRRTGDGQMELRLVLSNDSNNELVAGGNFAASIADSANGSRISGVVLVDPGTQARYEVLQGPDNRALCTDLTPPLQAGERRELVALFRAPPAQTNLLNLLFPKAAPIAGIPLLP